MLSTSHKFIFIHIPKTGGNSIQNVLSRYADDKIVSLHKQHDGIDRFELRNSQHGFTKHTKLHEYVSKLDEQLLETMAVFCVMRNPWDRMISFYFSAHRGQNNWSKTAFIRMLETEVESAESYISSVTSEGKTPPRVHFLRFESLVDGFFEMCHLLNLPTLSLPHRNRSEHRPYQEYYDDELIDLVRRKSEFEIGQFGYTFD